MFTKIKHMNSFIFKYFVLSLLSTVLLFIYVYMLVSKKLKWKLSKLVKKWTHIFRNFCYIKSGLQSGSSKYILQSLKEELPKKVGNL